MSNRCRNWRCSGYCEQDPARQKPILLAKAQASPQFYLVHTTDLTGINVARNDAEAPKDYSDASGSRARAPAGNDRGAAGADHRRPAMSIATPIRDDIASLSA
jgi:hypothetical protein